MLTLYEETFSVIEKGFRRLESKVPAPILTENHGRLGYRYKEKSIHQAIIQKMARYISALHSATILCQNKYFQEQGIIQRVLDEISDDIEFLALAITTGSISDLHKRYLDAFYMEEFDQQKPTASKRPMIPRDKIRNYVHNTVNSKYKQESHDAAEIISKVYSGFVHGASPHIMDMYGGNPPEFMISGISIPEYIQTFNDDLWNYFFRGILAEIVASIAIGDDSLTSELNAFRDYFEGQSGTNFRVRPNISRTKK